MPLPLKPDRRAERESQAEATESRHQLNVSIRHIVPRSRLDVWSDAKKREQDRVAAGDRRVAGGIGHVSQQATNITRALTFVLAFAPRAASALTFPAAPISVCARVASTRATVRMRDEMRGGRGRESRARGCQVPARPRWRGGHPSSKPAPPFRPATDGGKAGSRLRPMIGPWTQDRVCGSLLRVGLHSTGRGRKLDDAHKHKPAGHHEIATQNDHPTPCERCHVCWW